MPRKKKPTRAQAKEQGAKIYTGRPCKKCGGTTRYTASGNCKACDMERLRKLRAKGDDND